MKVLLHLLIFFFFFNAAHAQNETNITCGLKLGGIYSKISNLPESIKGRDNTFDNNVIKGKGGYEIEGGFF